MKVAGLFHYISPNVYVVFLLFPVVKKVAEFELPYVSLQSMKELHCKLGIRKW